jgi:hypothetical protein
MRATILKAVTSSNELQQVFKFRYSVYVDEMGRNPPHTDHIKRQLRHPLDNTGLNIAAYHGTDIVGVVRFNSALDGSFGPFLNFYGIDGALYDHPARTSISSGMMVSVTHRHRFVGARLAIASYEYALQRGVRWNFIDCIPTLGAFFEGLGYIEHLPETMHPEYHLSVKRLRLDLEDQDHLGQVRSPFLGSYRKYVQSRPSSIGFSDGVV